METTWDVVVIGAGAAGLFAATRAAERGCRVLLLEKNRKPAVKILMSGGTRCNLTHATDRRGIAEAFGRQGRFLHSPLAALGPEELIAKFEAEGVRTKIESTGKVFPVSDRALDVAQACLRMLHHAGATIALDEPVVGINCQGEEYALQTSKRSLIAERVILTTGGQSYPGCGTTGDGYAWAKALGHKIIPPRPALAPLTSDAAWVHALKGVTIPDVRISVSEPNGKPVDTRRGSLLFTHFGLSGPVAMDLSRAITERPKAEWVAECDFAPDEHRETLLERFASGSVTALGLVAPLVPKSLAEALVRNSGVPAECRAAELSKKQRGALADALKRQRVPLTGTLGFKKAEVTAGGVALVDVDSRDMQSKRSPGLFLAGEVLDLDGPIGGYNFQAAFSTGWLAGECV